MNAPRWSLALLVGILAFTEKAFAPDNDAYAPAIAAVARQIDQGNQPSAALKNLMHLFAARAPGTEYVTEAEMRSLRDLLAHRREEFARKAASGAEGLLQAEALAAIENLSSENPKLKFGAGGRARRHLHAEVAQIFDQAIQNPQLLPTDLARALTGRIEQMSGVSNTAEKIEALMKVAAAQNRVRMASAAEFFGAWLTQHGAQVLADPVKAKAILDYLRGEYQAKHPERYYRTMNAAAVGIFAREKQGTLSSSEVPWLLTERLAESGHDDLAALALRRIRERRDTLDMTGRKRALVALERILSNRRLLIHHAGAFAQAERILGSPPPEELGALAQAIRFASRRSPDRWVAEAETRAEQAALKERTADEADKQIREVLAKGNSTDPRERARQVMEWARAHPELAWEEADLARLLLREGFPDDPGHPKEVLAARRQFLQEGMDAIVKHHKIETGNREAINYPPGFLMLLASISMGMDNVDERLEQLGKAGAALPSPAARRPWWRRLLGGGGTQACLALMAAMQAVGGL